jgi:hypothetical protein
MLCFDVLKIGCVTEAIIVYYKQNIIGESWTYLTRHFTAYGTRHYLMYNESCKSPLNETFEVRVTLNFLCVLVFRIVVES